MLTRSVRSSLLLGVAFAGTVVTTPSWAQDASENAGAGDIIVTAQRVEQRLQDVPISITVFNQQQLTQRNIAVATDLAIYTPSLSVNQRYGPEKAAFNIRGFNQDQSTAPTVGVYFAEVVGVRAQGGTTGGNTVGAGAFTDLANVQVLKGPQGTLFGRNTTGGAVLLTPAKPSDRLEGFVEGTYGNYDQMKATGVINLPLADTFKVRLAVERNNRDGFMNNLSGRGPKDYNDVDYLYGRLSIVADLTPDLENYTIFHYSRSNTNGYATKIVGCANAASPISPLIAPGSAGFNSSRFLQATSCAVQLARQNARGDGFYDIESRNLNPFLKVEQWQAINTTTWRASDTITVKNIMSYGEFRERANFDLGSSNFVTATDPRIQAPTAQGGLNIAAGLAYDRTTLDTYGLGGKTGAESTFTEELQLQGHTDNLDFVIGGYLEFSRPIGFNQNRTASLGDCTRPATINCSNSLGLLSIGESSTQMSFDNHGVFGQATYNLTDRLSLTGGVRYTFDKIVGLANATRARFTPNAFTGAPFVDPIGGRTIYRSCTDSFRHSTERPGIDRSVCITNLTNKSSKPTWLANIDYKVTPDLMFYAKYARGYRQGGLNFTNTGFEIWKPEKLDAYEIGAKATFRGAVSGYLNVAGFYNNLDDQQVFGSLLPTLAASLAGVTGGAGIINAGKSRIYGLEVEAAATFFDSLHVQAGYTYLNTEVIDIAKPATVGDGSALGTRLIGTPFQAIIPTVQVGSPITLAPRHKLTVSPSYTLDLGEKGGQVTLGATWVHQSSYINDGSAPQFVSGIPVGFTPATDLINLNLDWKGVAGSPIDISVFVTNITKEEYNVANTNAWGTGGVAEILTNQPRFYGVRLRYTFGE